MGRPTLKSGPHLLMAGYIKDTEGGRSCSLPACSRSHQQEHPFTGSESTSSGFRPTEDQLRHPATWTEQSLDSQTVHGRQPLLEQSGPQLVSYLNKSSVCVCTCMRGCVHAYNVFIHPISSVSLKNLDQCSLYMDGARKKIILRNSDQEDKQHVFS